MRLQSKKGKTLIIAEAGVNHNGSIAMAKQLIEVAATAGADVVKFQTFQANQLVTPQAAKADYQIKQTDPNETQYEMLKKLELSAEDHLQLIAHCELHQIQFLSTPFDVESLDLLLSPTRFALPMLKIPSGEITNAAYLLKAATMVKPIILSTGMATLSDIEMALAILAYGYLNPMPSIQNLCFDEFLKAYCAPQARKMLAEYVTLLHCTTEYPAPYAEIHLNVLDTLAQAFALPVGYSDHSLGIGVAIAAVAKGATVLEKHFTLDRNLPGPDHQASLLPNELSMLVHEIRNVECALGETRKIPASSEWSNRAIARKSLVALEPIRSGEVFTEKNLGLRRPGNGVSGFLYFDYLGKIATQHYSQNEMIL